MRSGPVRPAAALVLGLAVLLSACSESDALNPASAPGTQDPGHASVPAAVPAGSATVRVVEACRLLTRDDAQVSLGGPVETVPPGYALAGTYHCHYRAVGSHDRSLSLLVDESPGRNVRMFMDNLKRNRREAVPDLGDEAYLFDSPAGIASLDVRVGDSLLQFSLSRPSAGRAADIRRLAGQALTRLASGEGVIDEAAPEVRLIGAWTAQDQGGRLLLSVRPDRTLTLSLARIDQLVLGSESDRWQLLDRARRAVRSGTLTWLGGNSFRTVGDITADWRRVSLGSGRTMIPAALTADSGIDQARPDTGASPWPRVDLDQRLIGTWEARGQLGGVEVELLWRIRADAPSTLVIVGSGEGGVQDVDRWRRVILNFSQGLAKTGRQLGVKLGNGAVVTGFEGDSRMQMQMHNVRQLSWTRVATP